MTAQSEHGVSNEQLTELALDAAIALDRALLDQETDQNVVTTFLHTLDGIVNFDQNQSAGMLVSDPRKVGVVYRAYRYLSHESVPTTSVLIAQINQLSSDYQKPTRSTDDVQRLRSFCIALHKELLAHAYGSPDGERNRERIKQNAA